VCVNGSFHDLGGAAVLGGLGARRSKQRRYLHYRGKDGAAGIRPGESVLYCSVWRESADLAEAGVVVFRGTRGYWKPSRGVSIQLAKTERVGDPGVWAYTDTRVREGSSFFHHQGQKWARRNSERCPSTAFRSKCKTKSTSIPALKMTTQNHGI